MPDVPKPALDGNLSRDVTQEKDPRVRAVLELLVRSGSTPSLQEAARIVNLSGSRLRHLVRQEIGVSPHVYVKQVRLRHARELIEESFLSVKEITFAAGFNDISHFLRDYKIAFGETPSQTRRKLAIFASK